MLRSLDTRATWMALPVLVGCARDPEPASAPESSGPAVLSLHGRAERCALLEDRSLRCWGRRYAYQFPGGHFVRPEAASTIAQGVVDFSFDDEGRPLAVLESGQLLTWSWTTSDGGATADLKLVEVEGLTDVVRVEEHLIWRADGSVVRWTPKGGIVPIAGVADATRVRCDMVVCWAVFPDGRVAAGGIENTVYSMVPQITAATDAIPGLGMDLDALVLEGSSARRVYVALPGHPEWRGPDRHWFVVQPAEVPDFAVDTGRCGLNAAGQPKCLPTTRLDGPDAHQRLRGLGGGLRLLSVAGGDACAVRGGSEVTCVAFAPDRDGAPTRIPL